MIVAALVGGLWGGTLAVIFSVVIAHFLFVPLIDGADWPGLAEFVTSCAFIVGVTELLLRTRATAIEAETAQTNRAMLASIVESSSDAILSATLEGTIVSWNAGAARMFGYGAEEVIGQPMTCVIPLQFHADESRILARLKTGATVERYETSRVAKNGRKFDVAVTISPIKDATGHVVGASKIIHDITEHKKGQQALQESEVCFRLLVEQAVDGIFLSDIEGHYVDVNSAGHTMLGYTREEVLSCTIADVIAPEELSRLAHEVAKLTEGQVARSEWRFRRKDGSEFIGEVVGRQLPDGRLIAILRDITERKKAEDQIRFLMGEVIHRSKNILAMVQAIARLSAKHADPVTFASDLSQRISSLSACQNLLVSSEWKGVDVAELVHTQLAPYRDIFDRRILLDGPTARLNSTAAQAVGMALHELATNAAKYGALSNHEGRVRVAWEIDARAETPMFSITWREEGGPKVAVPIRKGFGQNVIISMVENAVHGKVALEYQEAGVVWTLRSPVDASVDMD